jgi:hypothetical protein
MRYPKTSTGLGERQKQQKFKLELMFWNAVAISIQTAQAVMQGIRWQPAEHIVSGFVLSRPFLCPPTTDVQNLMQTC